MRKIHVFVLLSIFIFCITSCASGGFTSQQISIEPFIDEPLPEEININESKDQEKNQREYIEINISEEENKSSVNYSTVDSETVYSDALTISNSKDFSNTYDNQDFRFADHVQIENDSPETELTSIDSQISTESDPKPTKENETVDTKDIVSEMDLEINNNVEKLPKTIEKRDKVFSVLFGIVAIVILLIAIIMYRKGEGIRKKSFFMFAICVVSATLSILFTEHVFCKHEWDESTCINPQRCVLCGKTSGEALGHDFVLKDVIRESTCTEEGIDLYVCSRCGETKEEKTNKKEHVQGTVEITHKATYNYSGTKAYYCRYCNELYKTESYELSASEKEEAFKNSCNRYSYDSLARRPDLYRGDNVKLAGKIFQVIEDGDSVQYMVNITQEKIGYSSPSYFYDDTVLVVDNRSSGSRILEDDVVALYGVMAGNCTYTTVLGVSKTVPLMSAKYINRIRDRQYDTI